MVRADASTLLPELIERWAAQRPGAPAVVTRDEAWSYVELRARVGAVVTALRRAGVRPLDRAALRMTDGAGAVAALFACFSLGAVAVPVDPRWGEWGREAVPRDCVPSIVLDDGEVPVRERESRETTFILEPDDLALLLYPKRTSGAVRGAMHTHGRLCRGAARRASTLDLRECDVVALLAPLGSVQGVTGALLPTISAGATLLLPPRHDPAGAVALLESHHATCCIGNLESYESLLSRLEQREPIRTLGRCYVDGGRPSEALARAVRERLGVTLWGEYGVAELPGYCLALDTGRAPAGAIGRPAPGVMLRVVRADGEACTPNEVGEIWIRCDDTTVGYWNDNAGTVALLSDGWLRTGDLAWMDGEGELYLRGRVARPAPRPTPPRP